MQVKKKPFSKRAAIDHAANTIAMFWLKSANGIIERGGKPTKLSPVVRSYAREILDDSIYQLWKWTSREIDTIAATALINAKREIYQPEWEKVRLYFSVAKMC